MPQAFPDHRLDFRVPGARRICGHPRWSLSFIQCCCRASAALLSSLLQFGGERRDWTPVAADRIAEPRVLFSAMKARDASLPWVRLIELGLLAVRYPERKRCLCIRRGPAKGTFKRNFEFVRPCVHVDEDGLSRCCQRDGSQRDN